MKYAVIGGDRRSAALAELLHADGHRVRTFALERAAKAGIPTAVVERKGCKDKAMPFLPWKDSTTCAMPSTASSTMPPATLNSVFSSPASAAESQATLPNKWLPSSHPAFHTPTLHSPPISGAFSGFRLINHLNRPFFIPIYASPHTYIRVRLHVYSHRPTRIYV